MPSNIDLSKWQDNPSTHDAFSALVSGKSGYKTVIVKDKPKLECKNCSFVLSGEEKFCPECGTKIIQENQEQAGQENCDKDQNQPQEQNQDQK